MVTLHFDDGTDLTVTPDHNIPTKPDEGKNTFEEKKAIQVEEGDTLYDYNEDLIETVKNYTEFDVLEHLIQNETEHDINLDDVMIRGLEKETVYDLLREVIEPEWDGRFYKMKSSCEYLGITKKTLDNYLRRQSIPVTLFHNLYDGDTQKIIEQIPSNVTLGVNRDNTTIPRQITLDEELACLLGYYTAEGFTRSPNDDTRGKNPTGVRQVDFAATEEQARVFIEDTLTKKFTVENPYINEKRLTASGTLITYFFDYIVDSGNAAHTKEIPQLVKDASDSIKGAYLSGYISGDGTYFHNQLRARTVSEQLRDDVIEMFKSLGYPLADYEVIPPKLLREKFPDFYDENCERKSREAYDMYIDHINSEDFIGKYGVQLQRKQSGYVQEYETSTITGIDINKTNVQNTYNLTVENTHKLEINGQLGKNCDGDEDSVMLLMDGFLNFSEQFLPDRIGRAMDAPMIMTAVIDPYEVDDEAHNVDIVGEYPREWYEGTWELNCPSPKELELPILEDILDDPTGIQHSHETERIDGGVRASKYKSSDSWGVDEQISVCTQLNGVDANFVASEVIRQHFMTSYMGNLSGMAKQDFRCGSCNTKYDVPPLGGECTECEDGGNMMNTIHTGSVESWKDKTRGILERHNVRLDEYLQQRIELLDARTESLLEDDTNKQSGLDQWV